MSPGGGDYQFRDEILQYHADTEQWTLVGHMINANYDQAMSTINFEDIREHCVASHQWK